MEKKILKYIKRENFPDFLAKSVLFASLVYLLSALVSLKVYTFCMSYSHLLYARELAGASVALLSEAISVKICFTKMK